MKSALDVFIDVVFPIIVGVAIYILFGSLHTNAISTFSWVAIYSGARIPSWVRFNLPDGLWTYSLTYSLLLIWKRSKMLSSVLFSCPSLAVSFTYEGLQLLKILPGTFSIYDILSYCVGYGSAVSLYALKNRKEHS